MPFNSLLFIILFLPVTLLGCFWIAKRLGTRPTLIWLGTMAFVFYGVWNPRDIVVLIASILVNYGFATMLRSTRYPQAVLVLAVVFDLGLLGYFKYWNFLAANLSSLTGDDGMRADIVLPLAISFFTFTQIAYLVDVYRDPKTRYGLLEYANFVLFFPHLIAGPIIYHRETIPQFQRKGAFRPDWRLLTAGLGLFLVGLSKKVLIADTIAQFATPLFDRALAGQAPDFFSAWQGALAYTFQLYFDFSGYSDMAIGLALMLGIRLPANFFSPYKATSVIDFWRRWHVSLSRFVRDYLYIPLGGNRCGPARQIFNIVVTMLLVGLWHGAGWTFIVWGGIHGVLLALNHGWRRLFFRRPWGSAAVRVPARAATFLCVVLAWVMFRAESLASAFLIYRGMFGEFGATLPAALVRTAPGLDVVLSAGGIRLVGSGGLDFALAWGMILVLLVFVNVAPNSLEIFRHYRPALLGTLRGGPVDDESGRAGARLNPRKAFAPSPAWLVGACALTVACFAVLVGGFGGGEFIYFQF